MKIIVMRVYILLFIKKKYYTLLIIKINTVFVQTNFRLLRESPSFLSKNLKIWKLNRALSKASSFVGLLAQT